MVVFGRTLICYVLVFWISACGPGGGEPERLRRQAVPVIVLITLDTTRADRLGATCDCVQTPVLDNLAANSLNFTQAYTTAPITLPAHTSMLTGLYPSQHGIHENARFVSPTIPVVAEKLNEFGYATAAYISAYPLAGEFGLARGFDKYDDAFEGNERRAAETVDRALDFLQDFSETKLFLWVHLFDPHQPYDPPQPFRSRYPNHPYLGEIAYMDEQIGRLLQGVNDKFKEIPRAVIVVGDHGEGLGDHGEKYHGNLLYQGVMHVPLMVQAPDVPFKTSDREVSIRRVFDTILDFAGKPGERSLLGNWTEPVIGQAMKPLLQYGWSPQVMAVQDGIKWIQSSDLEVYDVIHDPDETRNLADTFDPDPEVFVLLEDFASPHWVATPSEVSQEAMDRLASLGYLTSAGGISDATDRVAPRDMTHLFDDLDNAMLALSQGNDEKAADIFARILEADPTNLGAWVHRALALSHLGRAREAEDAFEHALELCPQCPDLLHYAGEHYAKTGKPQRAFELLTQLVQDFPNHLPALEQLLALHEHSKNLNLAIDIAKQIAEIRTESGVFLRRGGGAAAWEKVAGLCMLAQRFEDATAAWTKVKTLRGDAFAHDFELGTCHFVTQDFASAVSALDRVPANHPGYPIALYRAALSAAARDDPQTPSRVRAALDAADPELRNRILSHPRLAPYLR